MQYIAAYLLSVMGGKNTPSNADISKILSSVGIDADSARIENLLSSIGDKTICEIMEAGRAKLATVPCGNASAPTPAATSGGPAAVTSKKEEKKEVKEESDEEPSFDLFG